MDQAKNWTNRILRALDSDPTTKNIGLVDQDKVLLKEVFISCSKDKPKKITRTTWIVKLLTSQKAELQEAKND